MAKIGKVLSQRKQKKVNQKELAHVLSGQVRDGCRRAHVVSVEEVSVESERVQLTARIAESARFAPSALSVPMSAPLALKHCIPSMTGCTQNAARSVSSSLHSTHTTPCV